MNNRLVRILISIGITLVLMFILVAMTPSENPPRLLVMFGGTMPEGTIQGLTYLLFVFGMLEIFHISGRISTENEAFSARLLPEKDNWVLSPDDVNQLKLNMQSLEHSHKFFLSDLIKKACTNYRLSKSSSEVLGLVDSQINIYKSGIDSEQAFIRYSIWAIPSVGFIGTVLGIAGALGYADQAGTAEGLKKVTDMLAVAFDTTLVALLLSLVMMLAFHYLDKKQEELFARMSSYLNENLINRFYK